MPDIGEGEPRGVRIGGSVRANPGDRRSCWRGAPGRAAPEEHPHASVLSERGDRAVIPHIEAAFEGCLRDGIRTRDLGGTASTAEFTAAVHDRLKG